MSSLVDRQQLALEEDVRRLVGEAVGRGIVCVATEAARLAEAYPGCGLSLDDIVGLITRMAGAANVVVKLAPPARPGGPHAAASGEAQPAARADPAPAGADRAR
jgi:hypothetical protein